MFPYQRFRVWHLSHELVLAVYRATASWPKAERFELTTQTRRAAYSIPMNIAEGSAKKGSREFRRYLDISLGSLAELSYCLLLARDLGHLALSDWERLENLRTAAGRLLWKLHRSVGQSVSMAGVRAGREGGKTGR